MGQVSEKAEILGPVCTAETKAGSIEERIRARHSNDCPAFSHLVYGISDVLSEAQNNY
jgi:hypothetical protein